jgi:hypothetical protein
MADRSKQPKEPKEEATHSKKRTYSKEPTHSNKRTYSKEEKRDHILDQLVVALGLNTEFIHAKHVNWLYLIWHEVWMIITACLSITFTKFGFYGLFAYIWNLRVRCRWMYYSLLVSWRERNGAKEQTLSPTETFEFNVAKRKLLRPRDMIELLPMQLVRQNCFKITIIALLGVYLPRYVWPAVQTIKDDVALIQSVLVNVTSAINQDIKLVQQDINHIDAQLHTILSLLKP